MAPSTPSQRRQSPSFFKRDHDGSVRVRLRFDDDTASLIEDAAGRTPLMVWVNNTLTAAAKQQVELDKKKQPVIAPPSH